MPAVPSYPMPYYSLTYVPRIFSAWNTKAGMEVLTGRGYSRHGTRAQAAGFLAQNRKSAWKCVPCLKAGTELLTGREVKAGMEVALACR
jgi:hypothetical protein